MKYIKPMLAEKVDIVRLVPLCNDDSRWAEQKVDGDRLLVYVEDGKPSAMSRNGIPLAGVSRLVLQQFENMPGRWVFDGEYLDGKYYLFDLVEGGGQDFAGEPYEARRAILEDFYAHWSPTNVHLLPVARTMEEKCELAAHLFTEGCEGIVFKSISERYRGDDWVAVKFRKDLDCVVMELGRGGHANFVAGLYRDGVLTEVGEVTAHAGDGPRIKVGDVVKVIYQYASEANRLVQPTFPKIRKDKAAEECLWSQLVFQNRTVRI